MDKYGKQIAAAILALIAVGLGVHALRYPFICDDAYISFRYAHNLAYHNELTFNLGQPVEGYTNFLWTALLGGLLKAGIRPDLSSRVLGWAFGAAALVLLHLLTRIYRGGRTTGWDFLGAAWLAASATFAVWCSGGLETQMFTALALAGVTLYAAEHAGRIRWRLSGLAFALAAMTRPEGLMLMSLTVGHHLAARLLGRLSSAPAGRRYSWRGELGWLAGFALPFGLFFAWRYSYYGYPLPNTFYVKSGSEPLAAIKSWGLPYLWDFIRDNKLYVLPALLPLFWPRNGWREARAAAPGDATGHPGLRPLFLWSYVALVLVTYLAYVVYVGGDFMALGRFFVPLLPLFALLIQEALRETLERPRRAPHQWRLWRLVPAAALLLGLTVYNSVTLYRANQQQTYYRWGLDTIAYLRKFADDRIMIGTWMRHNLPRDTYLAVGGAGALVYASRLRALDSYGLNESWIAHNVQPGAGGRPGHSKFVPDHYLLSNKPDLICLGVKRPDWGPFKAKAAHEQAEAAMWRGRGYGWACIDPSGLKPHQRPPELDPEFRLRPSYYCCLKRVERDLGPLRVVTGR